MMKYYRVTAVAKTDGKSIRCPRCGKHADITATIYNYKFAHYLECECTRDWYWHIGRRRGDLFQLWANIYDDEIFPGKLLPRWMLKGELS